jgi:hypothetical protein
MSNQNANKSFSFAELGAQRLAMRAAESQQHEQQPMREENTGGGYKGKQGGYRGGYRERPEFQQRPQTSRPQRNQQGYEHVAHGNGYDHAARAHEEFMSHVRDNETSPPRYNANMIHHGVGSRKAKIDKMVNHIKSMTGSDALPTLEEFIMMIQDHKFSFTISNPNQLDKFIYACEKEYEFDAIAYRGGEEYMIALLLSNAAAMQSVFNERKKAAALHVERGEVTPQIPQQENQQEELSQS